MRAFYYIASIILTVSVFSAHAARAEETDLRPVWMGSSISLTPNSSFLFSNQNPAFVGPDFQTRMLGQTHINQLKQDYLDRNRDYDQRSQYGLANTVDEQNHVNAMQNMSRDMVGDVRSTQVQQPAQQMRQSEQNGDVSKPLVFTGGVVALGMGTPVNFNLGNDTHGSWNGDLIHQHGQFDLSSPIVTTKVEFDAKTVGVDPTTLSLDPGGGTPELCRVSLSKALPFQLSSAVVYGSTTNSYTASLSRPLFSNIGASVSATRPANGENISTTPAGETVGVSYGIRF